MWKTTFVFKLGTFNLLYCLIYGSYKADISLEKALASININEIAAKMMTLLVYTGDRTDIWYWPE